MKTANPNLFTIYGLTVFAYDPQSAPETNSSSEKLSPGMTKYYSKQMLDALLPELVFAQFGDKEPIPEKHGDTINWRQFVPYKKASVLVEGVTPDPENLEEISVEATIVTIGAFTPFTDRVDLVHVDPIIDGIIENHSDQAPLTVDSLIRDELCTSHNVMYAPVVEGDTVVEITERSSVTSNSRLTSDVLARAYTHLRRQNAKFIDGVHYAMVVHPSVAHDIKRDPEWIDAQKHKQPEKIYKNEIGTFQGFRFFVSTNSKVSKDGYENGSVYDSIALGAKAFKVADIGEGMKIIVKQLGSSGTADPLDQRGTAGFKIPGFACKITKPAAILRVVSGSSLGDLDDEN